MRGFLLPAAPPVRHTPVVRHLLPLLLAAPALAQCPERVWSGMDGGANWEVRALASYDEDGGGPGLPALFLGGGFTEFAGLEPICIARWDGWTASMVAGELTVDISGLEHLRALDQWAGAIPPGLYAGGDIATAGGVSVNNIARWSPDQWSDVGGGVIRPSGYAYVLDTILF